MKNNLIALQNELLKVLKPHQILTSNDEKESYLKERRGNLSSSCAFVVLPNSAIEVSIIVKLCSKFNVSIVPEAGNTGLVGGAVANENQIILNVKNMNKILKIDTINQTVIAESGVILNNLITELKKYNLLFPLNLPAAKECLIGGNLATNAGGINTLKYGTIKNFTLGLEVVLANGDIVSDFNTLTKRNIGADYKNIFIGSEGTLGIITAASFKLQPLPKTQVHILIGCDSFNKIINLFLELKNEFNNNISAFETINNNAVNITLNHFNKCFFPINKNLNWYALVTIDFYNDTIFKNTNLNSFFNKLKELNIINNFYISTNYEDMWEFRNLIPKAQTLEGKSIKHDIALPLSTMDNFLQEALLIIKEIEPNARPVIFGHIGDSSLHLNVSEPLQKNNNFHNKSSLIKNKIIELVMKNNGTFSAEHGVGILYKNELKKYYDNNQFYMLKLLKNCLDPNNIFNPNKILV